MGETKYRYRVKGGVHMRWINGERVPLSIGDKIALTLEQAKAFGESVEPDIDYPPPVVEPAPPVVEEGEVVPPTPSTAPVPPPTTIDAPAVVDEAESADSDSSTDSDSPDFGLMSLAKLKRYVEECIDEDEIQRVIDFEESRPKPRNTVLAVAVKRLEDLMEEESEE